MRYPTIRCTCAIVLAALTLPTWAAIQQPLLQAVAPAGRWDPAMYAPSAVSDAQADRIVAAWRTEAATMPLTTLMLEMIVKHKVAPTRGARGSALLHVAMYDASLLAPDDTTRRIAVTAAAAQVLAYWFPSEEHGFDRIVAAVLKRLPATPEQVRAGLDIGRRHGQAAVARGESDGAARGWNGVRLQWYGEGRYYGPGSWTPTPPYFYYPPDEPFAPTWKTWVLENPGQLRPTPPPFGSERYLKDIEELVRIQRDLTPEQRRIAKFWVDGSGSVTPPGHWNQIAQDLVRRNRLDDRQTAALFAMLNIALADTFIAVWETKYYYWTGRPVTMVKKVLGQQFEPAILTPPFPSYVSGHAAFSGAAARIIGAVFPQDAAAVDAMAEEAAMSRLYGGIHYRHDNEDGLALGRAVAGIVLKKMGR